MPKNKDALIRYRIINRCLIDYRYVTMEKLLTACYDAFDKEVARRTIEKDIHDMRHDSQLGYYAPIKFDAYRCAYYYDDLDYSIDKIPLDYFDLEALTFASSLLDQYKSVGIFTTFSGAVQKIMNTMRIHRELKKYSEKNCVGFENVPMVRGQEYLSPLLDAILNRRVLRIEHQRFDSEEVHVHIVHPYYLKEYRSRWYLVGFQSEKKRIQTYGLERIIALGPAKDELFVEIPFDPEEYYRHAVGVIVSDESPAEVILRFTAKQGMYILTQPIHDSQKLIEKTDNHITVSLNLIPAYEFISMVAGWGADVELLQPEWLRERIAAIHRDSLKIYERD
jgi:predicted DNA-binding transcriptional regulator YafY